LEQIIEQFSDICTVLGTDPLVGATKSSTRERIINRVSSSTVKEFNIVVLRAAVEYVEKWDAAAPPNLGHGQGRDVVVAERFQWEAGVTEESV
jgi:hypothetical protein